MGWIADLLSEIPSAARYKTQLEQMEAENAALREKTAVLELKITNLESENQILQSKLLAAEEVIKHLTEGAPGFVLDASSITILQAIGNGMDSVYLLMQEIDLPRADWDQHIDILCEHGLANQQNTFMLEYSVTPKGRKYLADRNLLQ